MGREMAHDALAMIEYGDNPAVCIVSHSAAAAALMARSASAAKCRIASSELIGPEGCPGCTPALPILVELADADEDAAGLALDWAQAEAERDGRHVLISAPAPLIDLAAARSWHPTIEWLIDGDEKERVAAVAHAARDPVARLHDIGREDGQPILRQLTEDVSRIAAMLASLTDEETAALEAAGPGVQTGEGKDEPGLDSAYVRAIIRARRLRDQFFRGGLFADPAWDMLLDLMAARLESERVAVSSLCIAAAVPATTALRWIKAMTDRGFFVRSADPQDGRRVYIGLSEDAARALTAYLRAAQRIAPAAI